MRFFKLFCTTLVVASTALAVEDAEAPVYSYKTLPKKLQRCMDAHHHLFNWKSMDANEFCAHKHQQRWFWDRVWSCSCHAIAKKKHGDKEYTDWKLTNHWHNWMLDTCGWIDAQVSKGAHGEHPKDSMCSKYWE